jgi:hypothetical protein
MNETRQQPNLFELHADNLQIMYSSTGIDGKPHFLYQDQSHAQQFSGDQIQTENSQIGTLVSVSIFRSVDTGFTSFTLVVPRVNLDKSQQAAIRTLGITTVHRAGPLANLFQGQTETSTAVSLSGLARLVEF